MWLTTHPSLAKTLTSAHFMSALLQTEEDIYRQSVGDGETVVLELDAVLEDIRNGRCSRCRTLCLSCSPDIVVRTEDPGNDTQILNITP